MKTYKILGALLTYPSQPLVEAVPALAEALDGEGLLAREARTGLERLFEHLAGNDLMMLEETYVDLFDRVRSLSLHLFEHVHGESRDRGQALIDLLQLYERSGFRMKGDELPDYLPAFLEFLSHVPDREARALLRETGVILKGMGARLGKRGSPYAGVFDALLALCGAAALSDEPVSDEQIRLEDDPATLDAQWSEQPAFGTMPGRCGVQPAGEVSVVQFHARIAA